MKWPCDSKTGGVLLLLAVTTSLIYAPVIGHDFVRIDDYRYVVENERIQQGLSLDNLWWSLTTVEAALWKPITLLSHMLDCQLFGLNPAGHLFINLLIHVCNVLLVFAVLHFMTGTLWRSAFVAALFGLHPLGVESVAWVAERKNVLSTLFWLLTICAYIWYARKPDWRRYLVVFISCVLGLMTKPMLVTLPFTLLLLDWWPLERTGRTWAELRTRMLNLAIEKLPLLLPVAAVSAITALSVDSVQGLPSLAKIPLVTRLCQGLENYLTYLGMMVWPSNLAVMYPHPGDHVNPGVVMVAMLSLSGMSLWVWARRFKSPYLLTGWFWYLGTLVPVIGVVTSGVQSVADRYTYIPLLGMFLILAWGSEELTRDRRFLRKAVTVCAVSAVVVLALLARRQLDHWQNSYTLFAHTLSVTTDNYFIHNGMGLELMEDGRIEESLVHFQESIRIDPSFSYAQLNYGTALYRLGRFRESFEPFEEAMNNRALSGSARANLALALTALSDFDKAIRILTEGLKLSPRDADIHATLGTVLAKIGRFEEAAHYLRQALQINPGHQRARRNLGVVLARIGKIQEGIDWYREVLRSFPNDATVHNNLGLLLVNKQSLDEAIHHFSQALSINPNLEAARRNLEKLEKR